MTALGLNVVVLHSSSDEVNTSDEEEDESSSDDEKSGGDIWEATVGFLGNSWLVWFAIVEYLILSLNT